MSFQGDNVGGEATA